MINRVLIRIKVVQMLYSYLLTRSEFKIETAPESGSRDRKYAYQAYVDMLMCMLRLSGYTFSHSQSAGAALLAKGTKLADTKTARSLTQNEEVRTLMSRAARDIAKYDPVIEQLHAKIVKSAAYRDFQKIKSPEISDEVTFWRTIILTIFAKDPMLNDALRQNPDFTIKGMEKGLAMLVDTLIHYSDTRSLLADSRRDLQTSLDKAYELYHALLLLPIEITRAQEQRLEAAKEKFLPSEQDLNPNTKFIDNSFVAALAANEELEEFLKKHPFSWEDDPVLIKNLLDAITESDIYKEYMDAPTSDFASDCELWRSLMKNIILPGDDILEALEAKSIYWNDDLAIMGTFVLKTIKQFGRDGEHTKLLNKYKDRDDAEFGAQLFELSVKNREEYRAMIDSFIDSQKWDSERLALMDIVIMETALAEILNFPTIPIAVSVNEYVEIANWYSAPRSGSFINGLLAAVTGRLREEGKLLKQ